MERRQFLGSIALPIMSGATGALGCAAVPKTDAHARLAALSGDARDDGEVARDERFWFQVQQAYTADRSMINLNNGGICPAPAVVQDALKRYLDHAHQAPAYVLWRLQQPQKEPVRVGLAKLFGRDPEEIAITRNASESLENVQLGLALERGDEVVTSTQDYPRMLTTWKQRERRDGIVLKQIRLPLACEDDAEIVRRYAAAITPRTRVIHMCHVINLTGQILPVKRVVELARARNIEVVVDGAHSFGHLAFDHSELDCDYFGTSLHKFLSAPHGTGMLFVRKEKIRSIWPLMAAPDTLDQDIRKFEEIGTHPIGVVLAIADALTFHHGIGATRKHARLIHLRDVWAQRVTQNPRVTLNTSLAPGRASGVCNFKIDGIDAVKLADHLWNKERIFTVAIQHAEFSGVRISPHVYTTLEELERFCDAVERIARDGLPA